MWLHLFNFLSFIAILFTGYDITSYVWVNYGIIGGIIVGLMFVITALGVLIKMLGKFLDIKET